MVVESMKHHLSFVINRRQENMEQNVHDSQSSQVIFQEVIKRAYERGLTEQEITVGKLLDDIMRDLKFLVSK
jgi:hypothetical protein